MSCEMTPVRAIEEDQTEKMIGQAEVFRAVRRAAEKVAKRKCTVLITGQTGTGKQMLAEYIHKLSQRRDKPFVPVDCLTLTESLFESEVFGHVKGAFTGAVSDAIGFARAADGGTLFLDEISELSLHTQGKLLRLLQDQIVIPVGDVRGYKVDIRIIAATNKDLKKLVKQGRFREDLFYRLSVVTITMPRLCDRPEDIVPLAEYFLERQAKLYGEPKKSLSEQAKEILLSYSWPGNIRQLANVMEQAHILSDSDIIGQDIIAEELKEGTCCYKKDNGEVQTLDDVIRKAIEQALKQTNYCKAAAARSLGVNIQRFNRMMSRLGISVSHSKAIADVV